MNDSERPSPEPPDPAEPPDVAVCAAVQGLPTGAGSLDGLRFAAKDVFAVAGHRNACGSPDWFRTHPAADRHAAVVTALLEAGAELTAMTQMDELAFGLSGRNAHFGTPPNPAAPGHTAGGSSSGSASVVAGARADFALGTDTGGSVRVPASYCGIFGMRPTHGALSSEGVVPLAPSFDTVGWFARDSKVLREVGECLLPPPPGGLTSPGQLLIATELVERLDAPLGNLVETEAQALADQLGLPCCGARIGVADPGAWAETFTVLQGAEVAEVHGAWIRAASPDFGPGVKERVARAAELHADAGRRASAHALRTSLREAVAGLLPPGTLLALPSAPSPAPSLAAMTASATPEGGASLAQPADRVGALEVTSLASLTGIPQVSLPAMRVDGLPFGLSLAAASGADDLLLRVALRWSCP